MALIQNLSALNERLKGIPQRLGHPNIKSVTVTLDTATETFICRVEDIKRREIGNYLTPTTPLNGDELVLTDVNRYLDAELLSKGRYEIDGVAYLPIYVDPNDSLITHRIYIREYRNR
jgi:hypothetical protein